MMRALGSLGLAMRSGRVKCGEENCLKLIRSGEAGLILIDGGISQGSKKMITDACRYYGAPYRLIEAGALGQAVGRPGRMTAAITDKAFSERLTALLDAEHTLKNDQEPKEN